MTQITQKGRELATDLGLSKFGHEAAVCSLIMRHAATLQRLAEEECNGPGSWVDRIPYPEAGRIYDRWQARIEKRQEQLTARVLELAKELSEHVTAVTVSGDPRGCVVKLHRADGKYNTWGGAETGWAVPL